MDTLLFYESDSKLIKKVSSHNFNILNSKDKEFIQIFGRGQGKILNIQVSSIQSCMFNTNGELVIETSAGRKIIFKANSKRRTIELYACLNKVLENTSCNIRFLLPEDEEYNQLLHNLEDKLEQVKTSPPNINSILIRRVLMLFSTLTGFIILISFVFILISLNSNKSKNINSPAVEDISTKKIEENKSQSNVEAPKQTSSIFKNKDTKIASVILTISCAGSKGLIPRNQMGSMMKEMFADEGINFADVNKNWDYYWGLAKEMDTVNNTYCLK